MPVLPDIRIWYIFLWLVVLGCDRSHIIFSHKYQSFHICVYLVVKGLTSSQLHLLAGGNSVLFTWRDRLVQPETLQKQEIAFKLLLKGRCLHHNPNLKIFKMVHTAVVALILIFIFQGNALVNVPTPKLLSTLSQLLPAGKRWAML